MGVEPIMYSFADYCPNRRAYSAKYECPWIVSSYRHAGLQPAALPSELQGQNKRLSQANLNTYDTLLNFIDHNLFRLTVLIIIKTKTK